MSAPLSVWEQAAGPAAPDENAEPWRADALCAQIDPEMFFPEKGGSTRDAKKICRQCPVQTECLDYALRENEQYGIWGGLSRRERARLAEGKPVQRAPRIDRAAVALAVEGQEVRLTATERREAVRLLWARPLNDQQIAKLLRLAPETVLRIRQRLGLPSRFDAGGNIIEVAS